MDGKKLMSCLQQSTRDRFEQWIPDYLRPRYPDLEIPLRAAIQAFDTIQETRCATPELLAAIVDAASSSRVPLFENATGLLSELTGQFTEAQHALVAMAEESRSQVRFNAILCVGESTPPTLSAHVLRQALCDKSAKVRAKAADWIGRMRLRALVPELEEASRNETNEKAKKTIDFELRLLRDGYILRPESDGRFTVTAHMKNGGCTSRYVLESELNARGIEAVVAELAERPF